jgi:hypothetical protein
MTQADQQAESVRLKNDPPKIIFSRTPAVLVLIDVSRCTKPSKGLDTRGSSTHQRYYCLTPRLEPSIWMETAGG